MTLHELVTKHGDVPYNRLVVYHECYLVILAEKKYESVEEQSCDFDLETFNNEWFNKDDVLSGVKEVAERYIMNCLCNECGVPDTFYVHLIGNETEVLVEDDYEYVDENDVISHVFEVKVDIGKDFTPTEEQPYYDNYGDVLSCRAV